MLCRSLKSLSFLSKCNLSMQTSADIVVCGGGVIGASLAIALQTKFPQIKTVLIDANRKVTISENANNDRYGTRCLALNRTASDLLNEINVWPALDKYRCPHPVSAMKVWDSCSKSEGIEFSGLDGQPVAHIVATDVLTSCLHDRIKDANFESKLLGLDITDYFLRLHIAKHSILSTLDCKLLIVAGGCNASLLKTVGFARSIHIDYQQSAITCVLKNEIIGQNQIAYQRFLPTGPLAILPLSRTHSCMIWTADEIDLAGRLREMNDDQLLQTINESLAQPASSDRVSDMITGLIKGLFDPWSYVGSMNNIGCVDYAPKFSAIQPDSRQSFPLKMVLPDRYVLQRIALMGDSAHKIHPLAGQGANLGFADIRCFMEILSDHLWTGGDDDIGSLRMLMRYERDRQFTATSKALLMDALKRLYGTDFGPIVWARTLGSEMFGRFQSLKDLALKVSSVG